MVKYKQNARDISGGLWELLFHRSCNFKPLDESNWKFLEIESHINYTHASTQVYSISLSLSNAHTHTYI